MLNETHIWNILGDHFRKKGFVHHQIDSFNHYINIGIQRVIDEEPDIVQQQKTQKYTVKFGKVYIPSPSIIEENRNVVNITPAQARQRELTYDSPIHVDITEIMEEEGQEPEITEHQRVVIGRTPIMLRSDKCNINNCTPAERIVSGECEWDQGGYFIIKGKERVLVGQIRGVYNQCLVLAQKPNEKYKYICEIRSMSEETGHSVLVQAKIGTDNRTLVFSLPYIKETIPIGIIFKALGYQTEEDIRDLIGIQGNQIEKYLRLIIRDAYHIDTQDQALNYIGQYPLHVIKDNERRNYAWQVVETELFPHLGITASIKEKAYFLGHMVNRLLSTHIGFRAPDDRDNYVNKRIEMTGVLCRDLFRTLFKRYISTIKSILEKKKQHPDVINIISKLNTITTGLKHSFSTGNWGVQKNSYIRSGVSQVLSRLTFGATLSHLRRIVIPIGKEAKNADIRRINPSQIMFLCPAETPEGQSVGIVMNLTLLTKVSQRIPTVMVKEVLENAESLTLIDNFEGPNNQTKVFLNGILLGMVEDPDEFVDEVKMFRDSELLDKDISIVYDGIDEEVRIFSDEGRLLRPLFSVEERRLTVTEKDGTKWDSLVQNNHIQYLDNSELEGCIIAMDEKDLISRDNDFCEISPAMMLGVMASIIPFPDHSQSPRNCYQSAMGKQAIGMFALSHQIRTDTIVHVLDYPQRPLVSTMTSQFMGFNHMPSGINAIVAIACYSGFNQEDSVILNKSAVERGLFCVTSYRTVMDEEKRRGTYEYENISLPPLDKRKQNANYGLLDDNGVIRPRQRTGSTYVSKGDVIIGKVLVKSNKSGEEEIIDCSVVIKTGEEGYIDRIFQTITPNGHKMVKVVIRNQRIPEVGDKFASRAAQKGTCGMVFPQIDMPFTNEGIVPDIIINPHAIPSRMTINQLMECILGKSCAIEGTYGDATPFTSSSTGNIADRLCERLSKTGFERHGQEIMYNGMTGEPLEAQIFMGPTYYQRLKHMVSDKIHARSKGHVTTLTRQPLEGRSRDGGLRFGEMERDCMITHGVSRFLKERLFDKSDPYQVIVCNKCGNLSTTPTFCKGCDTDSVSRCNLPYASKLLLQELNAMGIKTAITVKK